MTVAKDDKVVYLFRYIVNFISDLNDTFGETDNGLQLYNLLLEKTGIINEEPIKKHISIFTEFLNVNKDAILEKNIENMKVWNITYSDKVCVDLKTIFSKADEENQNVIWEYLLSLLAVFVPDSNAKEKILSTKVETVSEQTGNKNEGDFLQNLIKKVESNIDPTQENPADIMNNILSNGFFNDVVNDMNKGLVDGELDLGKMVSSLQGLLGNLPNMMNENK
jgi:hypothetical protein